MLKNSQTYNELGYFFHEKLFEKKIHKQIVDEIISLANLFSKKIKKFGKKKKIKNLNDLDKFCKQLESYNKDYFFNFISSVSNLKTLNCTILNSKICDLSSKILDEPKESLLISRVSFLVNLPKNKRVLYNWHNAKNAYPKRNKCLNYWMPLILNKNSKNGTLEICEQSHKKEDYPFLEYKNKKSKNSLTQNQIPDIEFKKFKKKKINLNVGSVMGMHHNIVHRSTFNSSSKCSFVCVFKVWSIAKDWTLSSQLNQKYFSGDNGAGEDIVII